MHTIVWAVNANWNDDGWNLNANPVSNPNEWNADNRVVSRYSFLSPLPVSGVLLRIPLRHPPVMRPISSTAPASSPYCVVGINLLSHAICKKNRNESAIQIALPSNPGLLVVSTKLALRNVSRRSSNNASIRAPMPNLSSRAILRRTGSHKRYRPFARSTTATNVRGGGLH